MTPPLKNAIFAIGAAAAGVFFLAIGDEENWAGQFCGLAYGPCIYPEWWFSIGAILIALAVYVWMRPNSPN
jgi:hypothetical protein